MILCEVIVLVLPRIKNFPHLPKTQMRILPWYCLLKMVKM